MTFPPLSVARPAAVWLGTTCGTLATGRWAVGGLRPASSFDELLPVVAALLLTTCAVWAWVVTTLVVTSALLGRDRGPSRGVRGAPRWAQRLVLGACGIALVSTAQVPAQATPGHPPTAGEGTGHDASVLALAGLPLPDRTTDGSTGPPALASPVTSLHLGRETAALARGASVTVRRGDSLWSIAERLLDPAASPSEVADAVSGLYDLNRARIGSDPDLIFPGHQLQTPLGRRPAR